MNKLILCEGATDAILLSYYLEHCAGWKFSRKAPANLNIKADGNETASWYQKGSDHLLICAVGGKDNFQHFFKKRIASPLFASDVFGKIAVVTDRDKRNITEIESSIGIALGSIHPLVKNNCWISARYENDFGDDREISILLVVIPDKNDGALETVMLDAISEDPYDKNIVTSARAFTDVMREEAKRYISSERLRLKAQLGVTWAVQYPEKVFSLIDEQIRSVRWEEYQSLSTCFSRLIEI